MKLDQLQDLRIWHQRHWRERPIEKDAWDLVLTLWLAGCVGFPSALLTHAAWAELVCIPLFFLPGFYVAVRLRLHRARLLRCDWLPALGRREP